MFYRYTEEELRSYCRTSIETLEKWARIVIEEELKNKYGSNYFEAKMQNGDPVIKKLINDKANDMLRSHPDRFRGKIDTLFLEEIIYILCKVQLYKDVFKTVLDNIYPDGCDEARTYLKRLVPIRNKLSHSNPISIREAEKTICYCNDFVEGIKLYFEKKGVGSVFNVPHAIRINDSLGNELMLKNDKTPEVVHFKDSNGELPKFNVNDMYSLWITMDPSFESADYNITWSMDNKVLSKTENVCIQFDESMVGEKSYITCRIVQNKAWHKYSTKEDHRIMIVICVLPPI